MAHFMGVVGAIQIQETHTPIPLLILSLNKINLFVCIEGGLVLVQPQGSFYSLNKQNNHLLLSCLS